MKKIFLILLAALSLVLVACSPSSDTEGTTDSTTAEEISETKYVEFITSGKTEYRIIYPSNNTDADAAFRLSSLFSLALDASVTVKKDTFDSVGTKEIVIGKTNREETVNDYHSKLIEPMLTLSSSKAKHFLSPRQLPKAMKPRSNTSSRKLSELRI